jgi:endonuclease YncB( thermonuclease family)
MSEVAFEHQHRSQYPALNPVAEVTLVTFRLRLSARSIMKNFVTALSLFLLLAVGCASSATAQKNPQANTKPKPPATAPAKPLSAPSTSAQKPAGEQAGVIQGKVVDLGWGDSITVLDAQSKPQRVRLLGIDAPEKDQAFGPSARQKLSTLVFGKVVTVKYQKVDRSGRPLGKVMLGATDINLEMLKLGMAWYYTNDRDLPESDRPLYATAEREAKAAERGLWQDESPVSPWEFRQVRKRQNAQPEQPTQQEPEPTAFENPLEKPSEAVAEKHIAPVKDSGRDVDAPAEQPDGSTPFPKAPKQLVLGDSTTRTYFKAGCPEGEKVAPQHRVSFVSAEEAEKAGYKRTSNCP